MPDHRCPASIALCHGSCRCLRNLKMSTFLRERAGSFRNAVRRIADMIQAEIHAKIHLACSIYRHRSSSGDFDFRR